MTIMERYLGYIGEIAEEKRTMPEGISTEAGMGQAVLQMVLACAEADGVTVPQEEIDSFDPQQVEQMMAAAMAQAAPAEAASTEEPEDDTRPRIEEPDEPRNACEVLLDCCLLDDKLFLYLVECLKKNDGLGFFKLSQVTTKQDIPPHEFLRWLGTKEHYASETEQVCVKIMDTVLERLDREGETELLAALISGDKTTFELYRCVAPELVHLPEATYGWFEENYLSKYYPVRYMMRRNGVVFPQ